MLDRRQFLTSSATAVAGAAAAHAAAFVRAATDEPAGLTFSFGTYGMKTLPLEQAIAVVAQCGYDGIEIAARPDWNSAPDNMPAARRREARRLLDDSRLTLVALMEDLNPSADPAAHAAALERLAKVAELGHELASPRRPLIQTVLGGGNWSQVKQLFRDRLGDWVEMARRSETVLAIKPHRGGAMSQPSEAVWLIEQLGNTPWLRLVYDYSHYAFRDLTACPKRGLTLSGGTNISEKASCLQRVRPLFGQALGVAETLAAARPYLAHVAIKDAVQADGKVAFVLPGASGGFDYADLFRRLYESGYRGDVCCEVSGMVWGQPGYDPVAAARECYERIAPCFVAAQVPRRTRTTPA